MTFFANQFFWENPIFRGAKVAELSDQLPLNSSVFKKLLTVTSKDFKTLKVISLTIWYLGHQKDNSQIFNDGCDTIWAVYIL